MIIGVPSISMAAGNPGVIPLLVVDSLVTARLLLHPMTIGDAEQVLAGERGDAWAPGYPTEGDVFAARRFLETCENTGDPQPFGNYEIRRREDDHTIGGIGFHGAPDENGRVTIGYGLVPSARGNGYASEALRALLDFARARGVTRVDGDTTHDNVASQHVMTAAGMRLIDKDEKLTFYKIDWSGSVR
jgi:RimJ/RimL family protein N-acetyltransferase